MTKAFTKPAAKDEKKPVAVAKVAEKKPAAKVDPPKRKTSEERRESRYGKAAV